MKLLLVLVVMHTLDHFRPDKRCLCNDAFKRHHVVQLVGAEGSRVARELAKAANVCAIVYHILASLGFGPVCEGAYHVFEGAIEGFYEFEGLVQEAIGEFAVM
jgi:hypothetical protein